MLTVLIKNELNEKVSSSALVDWDKIMHLLDELRPNKRPALFGEDDREAVPEKLTIVILEGEEIKWTVDELEITVRSSHEEEY